MKIEILFNMATTEEHGLLLTRQLSESRISCTTNSSRNQRITRKRDHSNSASRNRSKSRDHFEQPDYSAYVKNARGNRLDESLTERSIEKIRMTSIIKKEEIPHDNPIASFRRIRSSVIEQENLQGKKNRKRQPTPVKSLHKLQKQNICQPWNENQKSQLELKVAGLENELYDEKTLRLKTLEGKNVAEKTLQELREVIYRLELDKNTLLEQKRDYEDKISDLKQSVLNSEKDLNQTKNSLNKLKQTIKENKISELQTQIRKLTKSNESLKEQIGRVEKENRNQTEELSRLRKQVESLQRKVQSESQAWKQSKRQLFLAKEVENLKVKLLSKKQERELFLEEKLSEKDRQYFDLKEEMKNLKMQMHFFKHSKEKQLREVKSSNQSEIKKLKVKYSKVVNGLKGKGCNMGLCHSSVTYPSRLTKIETSRLTKIDPSRLTKIDPSRLTKIETSRLTKIDPSERDFFSLSLSPENSI